MDHQRFDKLWVMHSGRADDDERRKNGGRARASMRFRHAKWELIGFRVQCISEVSHKL